LYPFTGFFRKVSGKVWWEGVAGGWVGRCGEGGWEGVVKVGGKVWREGVVRVGGRSWLSAFSKAELRFTILFVEPPVAVVNYTQINNSN
jgi:hypothetical protein